MAKKLNWFEVGDGRFVDDFMGLIITIEDQILGHPEICGER